MILKDVMKGMPGRIVSLNCDTAAIVVASTMAENNIGTVMLTDEQGRLAGIVSERDVVRAISGSDGDFGALSVRDLMTTDVISCDPSTSVEMALGLMSRHKIRHIPIIEEGEIKGLISARDLLDFQRDLLLKDIERRAEEAKSLKEAHGLLEERVKERTEELRQALEVAEIASKSKTDFLANTSHELRTPLNAIIGFAEIIRDQALGPMGNDQYLEYASDIHSAGNDLLSLINDILDLSKIEAGKEELLEDVVDVGDTIRTVKTLLRERAVRGGIDLVDEVASSGPPLWADARKLKQILSNLVSNAVKFTPEGGRVVIRSWSDYQTGYVIQVSDNGIGIAPDDIPRALSNFVQIDSELNRRHQGTGLGLPLTKALVEMHGGYLDLQSEVGQGTTVTIRFPAARVYQEKLQSASA